MANVSLEGLTLHVADLERSLAFYTRLPGVSVEFHKPGLIAILQIGKGRLGLLQRTAGRFHVELETDDLDGFYEAVRQAGIEPKGPPVRHPWGGATSRWSTRMGSSWNSKPRQGRRLRCRARGTESLSHDVEPRAGTIASDSIERGSQPCRRSDCGSRFGG